MTTQSFSATAKTEATALPENKTLEAAPADEIARYASRISVALVLTAAAGLAYTVSDAVASWSDGNRGDAATSLLQGLVVSMPSIGLWITIKLLQGILGAMSRESTSGTPE